MARIKRSIEIKAPVKVVFAFTRNWENYARFYEGLYDWRPTTVVTGGKGARFAYKARAMGREFEIETEVADEVENCSRSFVSVTGAKARGDWTFEPLEDGTKVTYIAEYTLPIPVIGRLLDVLFVKRRREAYSNKSLQNLKGLLER